MRLFPTLSSVLATLVLSLPAGAQNLLTNPDFDSGAGLADWNPTHGSWQLGADAGSCLLSASAAGTSAASGGNLQYLAINSSQCLAVDPAATPTLYLSALTRADGNVWARLYLTTFEDAGCGIHAGFTDNIFLAAQPTWAPVAGAVDLPEGIAAVRLSLDFNPMQTSQPTFTGGFDHLYLGTLPLVFSDGFEAEAGSVCRWSTATGS